MDCRIYLIIAIAVFLNAITDACLEICFAWKFNVSYLTLICTISNLQHDVYINDPSGKERGHCLIPKPLPTCYSNHNETIFQNRTANLTMLRLHYEKEKMVNGKWVCRHGSSKDKATVDVTIPEITGPAKEHDGMACYWKLTLWSLLGYVSAFAGAFAILWMIIFAVEKCKGPDEIPKHFSSFMERLCTDHRGKKSFLFRTRSCFPKVIFALMVTLAFVIPVIIGKSEENGCVGHEGFLGFGICLGLISTACFGSIKNQESDEQRHTTIPDQESDVQLHPTMPDFK